MTSQLILRGKNQAIHKANEITNVSWIRGVLLYIAAIQNTILTYNIQEYTSNDKVFRGKVCKILKTWSDVFNTESTLSYITSHDNKNHKPSRKTFNICETLRFSHDVIGKFNYADEYNSIYNAANNNRIMQVLDINSSMHFFYFLT